MLSRRFHASGPDSSVLRRGAQLPLEDYIEQIHLFKGPLDTCAHHWRGKTLLKCGDSVLDELEINSGYLKNVLC